MFRAIINKAVVKKDSFLIWIEGKMQEIFVPTYTLLKLEVLNIIEQLDRESAKT